MLGNARRLDVPGCGTRPRTELLIKSSITAFLLTFVFCQSLGALSMGKLRSVTEKGSKDGPMMQRHSSHFIRPARAGRRRRQGVTGERPKRSVWRRAAPSGALPASGLDLSVDGVR